MGQFMMTVTALAAAEIAGRAPIRNKDQCFTYNPRVAGRMPADGNTRTARQLGRLSAAGEPRSKKIFLLFGVAYK